MNPTEIKRLQAYLQTTFNNDKIRLVRRPNADDSVEVMLADEFIGVAYRDEDEGEVSFQFHMCVIEEDLPKV
ncbi:DUF3126 family protein [Kordiimonas marina]|uniref:DUF3126 family protein n=1 Tax=Kordiimonas marina TaxID=2872312 RepID=UPI001FF4F689|nr:DUF3126 family protein [Kordiimonas marina]